MFAAKCRVGLLVLVLTVPALLPAQQPRLFEGQPVVRSAAAGLEKEFRSLVSAQSSPAWIGYAVPMIEGEHHMCCNHSDSSSCCGMCFLEGRGRATDRTLNSARVELESSGHLLVLFRVEQHEVRKVRAFDGNCELDTGGLKLYWLADVLPEESVRLLTSFASKSSGDKQSDGRLNDGAVTAIAFHKDQSADRVLEQLASVDQPEQLREKASFWLGVARGRRGYEVLRRMIHEDPSERMRDKVVFALSQSREADAVGTMIEAAKQDKSEHVRGQALFWLAQKAGQKAADVISGAIEDDPDTDVKKKAVFALSQLPADDGIPRLIQVARTHRNPEVRKQAIFWLGQSGDPRALSFFEEILSH